MKCNVFFMTGGGHLLPSNMQVAVTLSTNKKVVYNAASSERNVCILNEKRYILVRLLFGFLLRIFSEDSSHVPFRLAGWVYWFIVFILHKYWMYCICII